MKDIYEEIEKIGCVYIVIGGQYGSESKGLFASHLCKEKNIEYAVRTGAINAGHTVFYNGEEFKNQQIPVGWVNPETKLVIGAGAYVNPEILQHEIEMIEKAIGQNLVDRLLIDKRAGTHLEKHREKSVGRHERMGTVGEGCSAALVERLRREEGCVLFKDIDYAKENNDKHFHIVDTVEGLNNAYDRGEQILLEGTQGTMLDVYLGHFPYTTSRQTIAASWMAEVGLSPNLNTEIAMVCRTFPIRVAGNSGTMPQEISWVELMREMNTKRWEMGMTPLVDDGYIQQFQDMIENISREWSLPNADFHLWTPELRKIHSTELANIHGEVLKNLSNKVVVELKNVMEMTTVTKKVRRISRLDIGELKYAVKINRPNYLVLFFLNYEFPEMYDMARYQLHLKDNRIMDYIKNIEKQVGVPIRFINWKPNQVAEILV